MFKRRKAKVRQSHNYGKKIDNTVQIVSHPKAILEVERIELSNDTRKSLEVPAAAFSCMAVFVGSTTVVASGRSENVP